MVQENGKTKGELYKNEVFDILQKEKDRFPLSEGELLKMQMRIEDLSMNFDEESIFKTTPNIIKILIKDNKINAKDYLKDKVDNNDDIELLSEFGQYTIEALIVHVLGMVFHSVEYNSIVRVATLVQQLETAVRMQAKYLKSRRCKKKDSMSIATVEDPQVNGKVKKRSKLEKKFPFGTCLVQFMEERKLIKLMSDLNGSTRVEKKKGHYYLPSHLYAICIIDISLLPIKLNLPMVCKPLDWTSARPQDQKPMTLSDLSGGYLSSPTGEIYERYRLLSTGNINNFYIDIGKEDNYENLCLVMNKLQGQAFQINSDWLKYIQDNEEILVESGLLMPSFLASLNINDVYILLRDFYMKDEVIKKLCSFNELINALCKSIQRARYEKLIIKLAKAYDGYHFYLPAFVDFRGRIYRSGIMHLHERDLARSMIVFANCESSDYVNNEQYLLSAAYNYKSFVTVVEAIHWFNDNLNQIAKNTVELALEAKRPFQFMAHLTRMMSFSNANKVADHTCMPITQDASASAYQIMSYFLLDETLAKRTNLIPSSDGKIQDVYSFILEELKEFMIAELGENNLSRQVCDVLTRKIVKSIFMPIIYGKTLMSTAKDLKDHLSHYILHKECFLVASVCFKFWRTKYPGMDCLIRMIRHIGWIASAKDSPVFYRVPEFTPVQDYMIMEKIKIWLYNSQHKKKHSVTLRVSSSKRDRRKTEISTFVNFIHQKDAHITMSVVKKMLLMNMPIYTVHDNFITTAKYSHLLPDIYIKSICEMGPPLSIINEFIYMNVIKPIVKREGKGPDERYYQNSVITKDKLHYYLYANIPENISKKMMATWEERIKGILTSYDNYTRNVCGDCQSPNPMDCWIAHNDKWFKFMFKLQRKEGDTNYSLHN